MKRILFIMLALVLAIGLMPALVFAADYQSGDNVSTLGENTMAWTGQGADITPGELNTVECDGDNTPYLLWIFTYDGGTEAYNGTTPHLVLNDGMGPYYPTMASGNEFHFVTPYYTPDTSTLTAVVHFYTEVTGGGPKGGVYNLVISHGCPGTPPPPPQATLSVVKFFDANANGVQDAGEPLLEPPSYAAWYFTINGGLYSTPFSGQIVDPGTYVIAELMPNQTNWVASTPTSVEITLEDGDDETVSFGNYCLKPSGGLTLGFWSNKNGQKLFGADDLALMVSLNLRKANGADFDPCGYSQFRTWLLSATATNMAYMLSAQLAAMELNVFNGGVDGGAFYIPYGGTINDLMTAANNALGVDGYTLAGNPNRDTQEFLKNCLDALNNGASVIPTVPCPYNFTLPV
jgi:hypothetical protein